MYRFPRHVFIYVDTNHFNVNCLSDIRRNYKLKSLILWLKCVECNDILKQSLDELHFTGEWSEIKLLINSANNTHFIVYRQNEGNTDLHNGDVKVRGDAIVLFMKDYSCSIMNSSTRIGETGARPHRKGGDTSPVN